ncbi:mycofactocin biosynthesis chaperone MftB [Actinospica sp. MGRD01-02]|uniref:Mycofactocin biosynthesis chaperone MftB n=1 Tax=Actinospica acidithermotolerans TaxID=2828514 RepID=A0A941IEW6_9ACTN|nr:mycofactocin biosynthesis chaperone MftB [Actinospica acidithermotolerans]MBR7825690.1 mycofactocin biosynthesis chaperone MftB [Actinospica acidithermotolerans]
MQPGRSADEPAVLDLDRAWALHPQVSVRPEPFGALLYHFGTRQLSFLKDRRLLDVVSALSSAPTARAACTAAGLRGDELPRYARALKTLARSSMLVEEADPTDRMVNP